MTNPVLRQITMESITLGELVKNAVEEKSFVIARVVKTDFFLPDDSSSPHLRTIPVGYATVNEAKRLFRSIKVSYPALRFNNVFVSHLSQAYIKDILLPVLTPIVNPLNNGVRGVRSTIAFSDRLLKLLQANPQLHDTVVELEFKISNNAGMMQRQIEFVTFKIPLDIEVLGVSVPDIAPRSAVGGISDRRIMLSQ